MKVDLNNLPDDIDKLQKIIFTISQQHQKDTTEIDSLKEERHYLKEQVETYKKLYFGKKSEKLTPEDKSQMLLFNEAEDGQILDEIEVDESDNTPTTKVKSYIRKKSGRKPLPGDLPREEVIHDLSDEEKKCECCGKERPSIGSDDTEELEFIPSKIVVTKHIRKKYGACTCDASFEKEKPEVITAAMPPRMIPGSIASPGLLAEVLTSKFVDSLPFYRQEKIFKRIDVEISRQTMCNWAISIADKCKPLIELMIEEIRSGPLIQMDETTVQVLKEPDKKPESKSYMWVAVGRNTENRSLIFYQYHPTRSKDIPSEFLKDYTGYLQTDGYAGYNQAGSNENIIHVGCFAHARRYFFDASKMNKKSKVAFKGLDFIQKLYKIEDDLRARELEADDFLEKRKKAVLPLLDDFHNWLVSQKDNVVPKSKTGQAVSYTLSEWDKLIRYIDHHLLTPDNNAVENAIRPFVIGRKNWLFSNAQSGAHASAVIYSLVESAKANKLEPYKYLRFLFTFLPGVDNREEVKNLLPSYLTEGIIDEKLGS